MYLKKIQNNSKNVSSNLKKKKFPRAQRYKKGQDQKLKQKDQHLSR